jgi:hypothetical protein
MILADLLFLAFLPHIRADLTTASVCLSEERRQHTMKTRFSCYSFMLASMIFIVANVSYAFNIELTQLSINSTAYVKHYIPDGSGGWDYDARESHSSTPPGAHASVTSTYVYNGIEFTGTSWLSVSQSYNSLVSPSPLGVFGGDDLIELRLDSFVGVPSHWRYDIWGETTANYNLKITDDTGLIGPVDVVFDSFRFGDPRISRWYFEGPGFWMESNFEKQEQEAFVRLNLGQDYPLTTFFHHWVALSCTDQQGSAYLSISEITPVPEPATILMLGFGLLGLAGFRKKFKR